MVYKSPVKCTCRCVQVLSILQAILSWAQAQGALCQAWKCCKLSEWGKFMFWPIRLSLSCPCGDGDRVAWGVPATCHCNLPRNRSLAGMRDLAAPVIFPAVSILFLMMFSACVDCPTVASLFRWSLLDWDWFRPPAPECPLCCLDQRGHGILCCLHSLSWPPKREGEAVQVHTWCVLNCAAFTMGVEWATTVIGV